MKILQRVSLKRGQNLIEYTVVIAAISAAVVAMSTYVYRAVQAKETEISEKFSQ
jgi:Flp pilus assembly pilin Flp